MIQASSAGRAGPGCESGPHLPGSCCRNSASGEASASRAAGTVHWMTHPRDRCAFDARNGRDGFGPCQGCAPDAPRGVRTASAARRCGIACVRSVTDSRCGHPWTSDACIECTRLRPGARPSTSGRTPVEAVGTPGRRPGAPSARDHSAAARRDAAGATAGTCCASPAYRRSSPVATGSSPPDPSSTRSHSPMCTRYASGGRRPRR